VRQATFSPFEDEVYEEIDLLDRMMPKHSVKPPLERELQVYEQLRANSAPIPHSSRLVLCVDTEDWLHTTQTCYLPLFNLGPDPVVCHISHREMPVADLVPAEYHEKYQFFKSIFSKVDGDAVSQSERKRLDVGHQNEFTYGEVEFLGLAAVLELCEPRAGQVFWDLGCGAGRALLAAALLYPRLKVMGVEFLPELCELCKRTVSQLDTALPLARITAIQGDILEVDWSNASLIYASSICFSDELMEGILAKAASLRLGAKFLTLKPLPSSKLFTLRHSVRVRMTWGHAAVYIFEKVR